MEMNLKLQIQDVYGGDGFTRPYQVESIKLSRSKKRTTIRHDMGLPVESEMSEEQKELKDAICHTFKRDEDGTPMIRIGGTHGKLWGSLKECAQILKDAKGTFNSFAEIERFMKTVQVFPIWSKLEMNGDMRIDALPQILAGRRSSMITQYFDVIPECTTTIKIVIPDQYEKKLRELLEQLQEISCLNKRRATIRVISQTTPNLTTPRHPDPIQTDPLQTPNHTEG